VIGILAAHLWQSTLFAAAAAPLTLAFRTNKAQVRYWLWLIASYKFLIPFTLLMSLGGHIPWAPSSIREIATATP
jgi:bla regulator protein blaR1